MVPGLDSPARLRAAVQNASDPMRVMQRIVDEAMLVIPSAEGAVVELVDAEGLTFACCAGNLAPLLGFRVDPELSLSGRAMQSNRTLKCDDAETDSRVDENARRETPVRSLVCVPLCRAGQAIGVLNVTSSRSNAFDLDDAATLERLGGFVTTLISAASELASVTADVFGLSDVDGFGKPNAHRLSQFVAHVLVPSVADEVSIHERVAQTIVQGAFKTVFQPIVSLCSGATVAVEALTRFVGPVQQSPDKWFAEAQAVGLGTALELATFDRALNSLDALPRDCRLAVNISPDTVVGSELRELLHGVALNRLTIELTEHAKVCDYELLRSCLFELRDSGAKLAIDDTGAGFSSFSHIVKLAPDVIKLDLDLTRGIDLDPVRRSLATAVLSFARETGAEVVAEGIERRGELETLRRLGVEFGQGFLLGRPWSLEAVLRPQPLASAS